MALNELEAEGIAAMRANQPKVAIMLLGDAPHLMPDSWSLYATWCVFGNSLTTVCSECDSKRGRQDRQH